VAAAAAADSAELCADECQPHSQLHCHAAQQASR
jgi:hypothetical protein